MPSQAFYDIPGEVVDLLVVHHAIVFADGCGRSAEGLRPGVVSAPGNSQSRAPDRCQHVSSAETRWYVGLDV